MTSKTYGWIHRLLAGASLLVLGVAGITCAAEETEPTVTCGSGQVACGSACVDLQIDIAHCGTCGNTCDAAEECSGGVCQILCDAGFINCGGNCVDITSNTDHCGTCDAACGMGQICNQGDCECTGGLLDCGDFCADTASDVNHCGACNKPCADANSVCIAGQCQLDCPTAGLTKCTVGSQEQCVDTSGNPDHCGFCNFTCGPGFQCMGSSCVCPDGVCGACGQTDIGNTVPQTVMGDNSMSSHTLDPMDCGFTSAGKDVSYLFTAPAAGFFTFDTLGSVADTLLYAIDPTGMTCGEIGCDTDGTGNFNDSMMTLGLTSGQQILLMVDSDSSFDGEGAFTLNISQSPQCPPAGNVLTEGLNAGISTVAQTENRWRPADTAACSSFYDDGYGNEIIYTFTADTTTTYRFASSNPQNTNEDFAIYIREATCDGTEVGCVSDTDGVMQVDVDLTAGTTYVVFIDGDAADDDAQADITITQM